MSECDEIKSDAGRENVNMTTEGEEEKGDEVRDDGIGAAEFTEETEHEDNEPSELDCMDELRSVIPQVIEQHDIGLVKLDQNTGKAILTDALRK